MSCIGFATHGNVPVHDAVGLPGPKDGADGGWHETLDLCAEQPGTCGPDDVSSMDVDLHPY